MRSVRNSRGITLVELMTIVVLIGIIAAMAMPEFGATMSRLKFRNSARQMLSKLRLARSNAISNKQQFGVHFDQSTRTMTVFQDNINPAAFRFETGDSAVSVDTLPEDFVAIYPAFGGSDVVYRPNGSASATGNILFIAYTGCEYVNFGIIQVLASTGRTKIDQLYFY